MKQTKKPTRDNKELISKAGLDASKWRVVAETRSSLTILDGMGNIKVLEKK